MKNKVYLCDKIDYSFISPIQDKEVGIRVDTCTKRYYPDDPSSQLVSFPDGTKISVLYDGALPYLSIRIDNLCYSRASVHTAVSLPYVRGLEPVCIHHYACRTYVD